jgi:osmoprotectant transport system ATP-binding protein
MIVLERVSKSYDGGATYSVRHVSFQVPAGQLLVLLGGSGCGKTTTLKMINRLVEPTAGRIEVNGRNIS